VKLLPPEAPMRDPVTLFMCGCSVARMVCFSFLISHFLIQWRRCRARSVGFKGRVRVLGDLVPLLPPAPFLLASAPIAAAVGAAEHVDLDLDVTAS
jgi:hypothetical protein